MAKWKYTTHAAKKNTYTLMDAASPLGHRYGYKQRIAIDDAQGRVYYQATCTCKKLKGAWHFTKRMAEVDFETHCAEVKAVQQVLTGFGIGGECVLTSTAPIQS